VIAGNPICRIPPLLETYVTLRFMRLNRAQGIIIYVLTRKRCML
jgi:hypothetical protein